MTEQTQQADDPSGDGWRDVMTGDVTQDGDMVRADDDFPLGRWVLAEPGETVTDDDIVRRRIEPQQPSDSEPETIDSWEMRLAKMTQFNLELEALVAEAERSGQQVNAELQQLREQVAILTANWDRTKTQLWDAVEARQKAERELATETKCYRDSFKANHRAGQQQVLERLQEWLTPVLELVAENPEDCGPLAVSVLGYLPGIASRLIEE